MSIVPVPTRTSAADNPAPNTLTRTGSSALGKDEFLKILVAQLANQDPTQPQDSSTFVAELAQFSSLESQQNTVSNLNALMIGQATANQTAATAFIGKQVEYHNTSLGWDGTTPVVASVSLAASAQKVSVSVADSGGNVVRTIPVGASSAGDLPIVWDGRDDKGRVAPAGTYTFQPTAYDAAGKAVAINLSTGGTVSGVAFEGGVPLLRIGTELVKMSDVTSINERNNTP
jgi:flagellar basal-body rod modification protein FlgD